MARFHTLRKTVTTLTAWSTRLMPSNFSRSSCPSVSSTSPKALLTKLVCCVYTHACQLWNMEEEGGRIGCARTQQLTSQLRTRISRLVGNCRSKI